MGCCGSKEEHDEDDLNAPLLPHDETASGSHMNYQSTDTMDVKKEQDFWTQVIERTTRHLIDISSSQTDPLQSRDVQERVDKYRALLDQLEGDAKLSSTLRGFAKEKLYMSESSTPFEQLSLAKPNEDMTEAHIDWLYQAMDTLQDGLQQVQVSPVGDMVVHLMKLNGTSY